MDQQTKKSKKPSWDEYLDTQMSDIEERLQQYEKEHLGLHDLARLDAPKELSFSIDQLSKMTPLDLMDAKLRINQYSLYLQRKINKEYGWKKWAESRLNDLAGEQVQYISNSFGYNERMLIAKTQHPHAKALNSLLRKIELRISRLSYIPSEINKIAETINEIKFIAMKQEKL